jgi:hypothetical protein
MLMAKAVLLAAVTVGVVAGFQGQLKRVPAFQLQRVARAQFLRPTTATSTVSTAVGPLPAVAGTKAPASSSSSSSSGGGVVARALPATRTALVAAVAAVVAYVRQLVASIMNLIFGGGGKPFIASAVDNVQSTLKRREAERRKSLEIAYARKKKQEWETARRQAMERGRAREAAAKLLQQQAAVKFTVPTLAAKAPAPTPVAAAPAAAAVTAAVTAPTLASNAEATEQQQAKAYAQRKKAEAEKARQLALARAMDAEDRLLAAARAVANKSVPAVAAPPAAAPVAAVHAQPAISASTTSTHALNAAMRRQLAAIAERQRMYSVIMARQGATGTSAAKKEPVMPGM